MLRRKTARFKDHQHARVLERRKEIAALYLQGKSQYQIAKMVTPNVTQRIICKELKAVREEWLKSAVDSYAEAKAKELAKIDHVEEVAWEKFWESCKKAEQRTTKREKMLKPKKLPKVPTKKGTGLPKQPPIPDEVEYEMTLTKEQTERVVKGQVGDPRWIDQVKWCVEMRCKILDLVKPPEINQTNVFNIGDVLDSIPVDVPDRAAERVKQILPLSSETV